MKFWEIYQFELYCQLRRPATWIHFAAVFGLLFLVLDEFVQYAQTVEEVLLNSPMMVADLTGFANKFGLLLIAALVGDGAMRDVQARMDSLLYTSSLTKMAYLGGRFLGTFTLASVLLLLMVPLSLLITSGMPGMDTLFGTFMPLAYLNAGLFLTVPSVFAATALLYALVLLSRHAMAAYAGGLLLFVLSQFSVNFTGSWELGKLIDFSGITEVNALIRTLTPLEKNTALVALEGTLLINRVLWISMSVVVGGLAFHRFQLAHYVSGFRWRQVAKAVPEAPVLERTTPLKRLTVSGSFDSYTRWYQMRALALDFYRETVMSVAGLTIPVVALIGLLLVAILNKGPIAYPLLPTTYRVSMLLGHPALEAILVMLISFFAGQLIWRERDVRLHDISDAMPVSSKVLLMSKYGALALVIITLQVALLAAGIGVQLLKGYYQLEVGTYLQQLLGFQLLDYLLFAAVALSIHVLVNQKYVGHLLVVLFYLYTIAPSLLGVEHKLLIVGSDPGLASSIFYSQSQFVLPWALFKLYWLGWAVLFMLLASLLWVRGRERTIAVRLQQAWAGLKRSPVLVAALLVIATTGGLIFYNTNVRNDYQSTEELIEQQVAYERRYGQYRNSPQPHLTTTDLQVEFYPQRQRALVQGSYYLKNSSGKPVDTLHLTLSPDVATRKVNINRQARQVLRDSELGYLIYALGQPLLPGDSLQLQFELYYEAAGFSNQGVATTVMNNGTWVTSWEWLPAIGYQESRELSNERLRKNHGLAKRQGLRSPYDAAGVMGRAGREKIQFEAVLGTAVGQTAIAPGSLKKTWKEGNRQYFHYISDAPIRNMYHLYSAAYQKRESHWKGVAVQLFHHPQSSLNRHRFMQAMKASLEYYSKSFTPYQYQQLSFVEYPDSGTGAISLPGTVGYSTNLALLDPSRDNRGFDLPFAVVAHEVAHQWWGHQLLYAHVAGAPLLSEGLAWYSALGVVEQEYGPDHLRKLLEALREEYLNPRTRAAPPLLLATDDFQGYRKGPLALYALREYVGEERVNRALQKLLYKFRSAQPPFATSLDFYAEMEAVTPDSLHYLLRDLFKVNTFWELETKQAKVAAAADGQWLLTLDVQAKKVQVDTAGLVTELPMHDWIEVGAFGENEAGNKTTLYLQKQRIRSGENRLVLTLAERPVEAGIDPRHLLIDTETYDNVTEVTDSSQPLE